MIIGILAALSLPGYRKITMKSKASAVVNDLRTFSAAFVNFNLTNARYPTPSGVPGDRAEIGNGLSAAFMNPSPIGGKYLWNSSATVPPPYPYGKASISIVTDGAFKVTDDMELLEMIDRLIDDGDTNAGSVQLVGADLVYVIEQ